MNKEHIYKIFLDLAFETSNTLNGNDQLDVVYSSLLKKVVDMLDYDYGEIWAPSGDFTHLCKSPLTYTSDPTLVGFSKFSESTTFRMNEGLPGRTWHDHAPIWVDNVQLEPTFIRSQEAMEYGITTGVTMPIFTYDVLNAVFFFFSKKQKKKDALFLALLTNISKNVGIYLMQQQLRSELHEKTLRLDQFRELSLSTIERLFSLKDPYTISHQNHVRFIAKKIAERIGLNEKQVKNIEIACLLHDLGKIGIPQEILSKPSRLSIQEYELIKTHPQMGYDAIQHFDVDIDIKRMVLEHHERLDGSGYPRGLRSGEILFESQLVAVSDIIDAMLSHRPYRSSLSVDQVINELLSLSERKLDKNIIDTAVGLLMTNSGSFIHV